MIREISAEVAGRIGPGISILEIQEVVGALCEIVYERTEGEDFRMLNMAKNFAWTGRERLRQKSKKAADPELYPEGSEEPVSGDGDFSGLADGGNEP